jgi:hypothetical protein
MLRNFIANNQLKAHARYLITFLVESENTFNQNQIFSTMLTIAKNFLRIRKFYHIVEDIDCFYEFIGESFRETNSSLVNCLNLMKRIMEQHEATDQIDYNTIKTKLRLIIRSLDEEEYNRNMEIIDRIDANTTRDNIKNIVDQISNYRNDSNQNYFDKIHNMLNGNENLGFVSVIKLSQNDELIKLGSSLYSSHKVAKPQKLDVVLYDVDVLSNIYPVVNEEYENDFFYYNVINNIGNYIIHYFSYDAHNFIGKDCLTLI